MSTTSSPRLRRTTSLCLALLIVALLASCSPPAGPAATPTPASIWDIPVELDGTSWQLVELNGQPLVAGTVITLMFEDGSVSGSAGCNSYGGPLVADPAATPPAVGFTLTKRACAEDGVMTQEQAYISALSSTTDRSLVDRQLQFRNAAGETVLVFEPAAA